MPYPMMGQMVMMMPQIGINPQMGMNPPFMMQMHPAMQPANMPIANSTSPTGAAEEKPSAIPSNSTEEAVAAKGNNKEVVTEEVKEKHFPQKENPHPHMGLNKQAKLYDPGVKVIEAHPPPKEMPAVDKTDDPSVEEQEVKEEGKTEEEKTGEEDTKEPETEEAKAKQKSQEEIDTENAWSL